MHQGIIVTDTHYPEYLTRELFSSGGEIRWFYFHSRNPIQELVKALVTLLFSAYMEGPLK